MIGPLTAPPAIFVTWTFTESVPLVEPVIAAHDVAGIVICAGALAAVGPKYPW